MAFAMPGRRMVMIMGRVFLVFLLLHCWLPGLRAETVQASTKMLLLSPVRVVFTERERALAVNVSNSSLETIAYTVSLVTMRKDHKGAFHEVSDENEHERLAKSMIRYAPRRATIAPGTRQVVKLMVQKPADLPAGEYQTRLRFTPIAGKSAADAPATATADHSQFALDILVASSIPVVVQHGVRAEVTPVACIVRNMAKKSSAPFAEVRLERSGEASAFGNLIVSHASGRDQRAFREIGRLQGMAFYQPDHEQAVKVPLRDVASKELDHGTFRVVFEPDSGGGIKKRGKEGSSIVKEFPARSSL